jgi:hypothetical protein
MGNFSNIFHHHNNRIMFLSSIRKLSYEVHGKTLPLPLRNGKGMQQTSWMAMLNLDLLTFETSCNKIWNFLSHTWPKVLLIDRKNGLLLTWMSNIRSLMNL